MLVFSIQFTNVSTKYNTIHSTVVVLSQYLCVTVGLPTKALRFIFATFGLPQQIVSDNSAQFTSIEFNSFVTSNFIRHIRSAPFHPATNGLAERFVQSFKAAMKSAKASKNTVDKHLASFLIAYRN